MSMIKVIQPQAQNFSDPVASLIKISSRGIIGNDRADLVKRAGAEFVSKLDTVKFAKDEVPIHLIAIGATEAYGANRNGDGFTDSCCRTYHPTFKKHAKFYRDHCFPAGTLVTMANRQRKPIETIKIGDMVATLEGAKPVTALMRNDYSGPGRKLKLSGVATAIVATDAHPVLVLRREQLHCRHKYNRLGSSKHGLLCREFRAGMGNLVPTYVPIEEVRKDDYLLIPRPEVGTRIVEPAFARLLGWVGSEGCTSLKNGSIQFTFSSDNHADIRSVTQCLEANGLHVCVFVRDDGLTQLSSTSKPLVAELNRYIRGKLSNKHFTGEVLTLAPESLMELMAAYIDGDGHIGNKCHKGQLRIRSSARQMLAALSDIVRALGIHTTVQWDIPPGTMLSPTNGKTYDHGGSGVVNVNSYFADTLARTTRKRCVRETTRAAQVLTLAGCQLARVLSVEEIMIDEPVYNLEVAGPHHYVANEVVVHNCNKQPEISYGTVKESAYHEPMKRIELICALNSTKEAAERNGGLVADKEIEKLASGKDIPVSMACTVAYDVCSSCGNKAKTRADYCDSIENGGHCKAGGLKHNIGKVLDDGHILHADNPHPKFFDISHVFRPADRIAYVSGELQKAAAAGVCISGAELADQMGVTAPIDVLIDRANVSNNLRSQIVALEKLAAADRTLEHVPCDHWHHVKLASAARGPLPHPQDRTKISEIFKAAADVGVIFPLREFLGMVTRQSDSSFVEKVAAALPGVFAALADDPAIFERLESNPYTPATTASAATKMWAVKIASDYSVLPQDTQRRAFRAALQNVSLTDFVPQVKSAKVESNSAAVTLAKQYALYKVAAYAAFCENFGDTCLTAAQCIMQN